jgi:hypothetical protein
MHILIQLISREAAFLGLLAAIGAWPASLLSRRFDAAARVALAPILGFCLATCLATTSLEFLPTRATNWVLVPLAAASMLLAMRRSRYRIKQPRRGRLRDVAQIALVCLAVLAPVTSVLSSHHTVGPVAYYYTDVDNYVGNQDGAMRVSTGDARADWLSMAKHGARYGDLTQRTWSFFAWFDNNLDATPLGSDVTALLGLHATDTNAPFLVILMLMGALAAFAAVRYATRSPTWTAVLAGGLFGGPLVVELWFDSFQAAIVALGLVLVAGLSFAELVRAPRRADLVLLALVFATLTSTYPLYLPVLVGVGALVLLWRGIALRERLAWRPTLQRLAASAAGLGLAAAALNPIGIARDYVYAGRLARNEVPFPRVQWHLPLDVLPGWLLQTREFWYMPRLAGSGLKQIALGAIVPGLFLLVVVVGLRRHRFGIALVVLAAAFAAIARYAFVSQDSCTYCAERDLLPLVVIGAILLTLGIHALLSSSSLPTIVVGLAAAVLVVVAVGQRTRVELQRFDDGAYFLDTANRQTLARVPPDARSVHIEGFGQTIANQAEQPLVYHLVNEHLRGRVSISLASPLGNATQYLNGGSSQPPPGPEFHPGYDYVLTRFGAISTNRRLVTRHGPIALEQRVDPIDVTPYAGLGAPLSTVDQTGTAWVQTTSPLQFHVVGPDDGRRLWVRLSFRGSEPFSVSGDPRRARNRDGTVVACVPVSGTAPYREAAIQITAAPVSGPIADPRTPGIPSVLQGVKLTSMRPVSGRCRP